MDNKAIIKQIKNELAETVLDIGIVDADNYAKLSRQSKQTNEPLYNLLIQNNFFNTHAYLNKLSDKYGIEIDNKSSVNSSIEDKIPVQFCNKNAIAPISIDKKNFSVGICIPSSLNALKNLSLLSERKVKAKFIDPQILLKSLGDEIQIPKNEKVFESKVINNTMKDSIESSNHSETDNTESELLLVKEMKEENVSKNGIASITPIKKIKLSSDVVKSVDEIFTYAIETGVSDIHFEVFKDRASIRIRKNGSLVEVDEYHKFINDNYNAVVARIKILANLDIAERRLPQDGKINFITQKSKIDVDFRVSVLPTSLGERVVIRILNSNSLALNIEDLGFSKNQLKEFIQAIDSPQGMILVTGPTGSGKSTTLYGAINYLNKPNVNILTAEDPVEYTISGISQVQVREDIGLTFASALRSFLRQDPEIILVGEIRDSETADIATKAALTGHLVLSTLHTNSAIGAISRLINMGLPTYLISSALSLVVAQRLIRVNCTKCQKTVEIDSESLSDILKTHPELKNTSFKQGQGCNSCLGSGYDGRIAIHEVLAVTNKIQSAINLNKSDSEIYEIAVKQGFKPMTEAGISLLKDGVISFEEFVRAIPSTDLTDNQDD